MAQEVVGSVSWSVFVLMTLVGFGWVSYMAATGLARSWRPWWQVVFYGAILGVANRLLEMMLYQGELLSLVGYVVDTVYIIGMMLLSYRLALTRIMVMQYPWLYERAGILSWREKPANGA
jgi:hypothetical protein